MPFVREIALYLAQTFSRPTANPALRMVARVKSFVAALTVTLLAAACSSGGGRQATVAKPTSTSAAAPTSSTASPASTCGSQPPAGKSGGAGDVTPPGDIPDNQAFVAFSSASGRYTIKVPEGWARSDAGAATSFTDKLNTIRVELTPAASAPSAASAQAQDVPAVQTQGHCVEAVKVTTVARRAGPAVLITYRADSAPDPVTGKVVHDDVERYEFWKAGTESVITLSSPQGSDNVDPWRTVTDSFTWSP